MFALNMNAFYPRGPYSQNVHILTNRSGNVYDGDWVQGVRSGKGTMTWIKSNESYSGEWHNGIQVHDHEYIFSFALLIHLFSMATASMSGVLFAMATQRCAHAIADSFLSILF